jgi:heme-degrading monooxygenase HmoA
MSVIEIVRTTAPDGKAGDLRAILTEAMPVFGGIEGCLGAKALQAVESEDPHLFHLLIEWESVEAHLAWRDSKLESRAWFLENVRPLMSGQNLVGHYVQFAEA